MLKKSEKHLKFILENSMDVAYQRNIQTNRYEYISPVIKNIIGYSCEEMINFSLDEITELIHPDDLASVQREIELTSGGEKKVGHVEYRLRNKNGEYRWLDDRFSVFRNEKDQPLYRVGIVRDVTQRKQVEEALRKSEERFRQYFNMGLVGMAIETPSGDWLEVNEKLCEMLGYTREELMQVHWKELTHPDDLNKDLVQFNQLIQGEISQYSMEKRYIHKSGKVIHAILSVGSARTPDGKLGAIFALIVDITEQKRAEEALAVYKDKLEIKVKKRTKQLQEAYDKTMESQKSLKEANKQLKQYARRITQVQEEERKRIAYELHDDTAQYLSILKMQIGALAESTEVLSPKIKERLQFLEKDADRAFNDVRRYSHELRPVVLEHQGIAAALEQIADDYNILGQLSVVVDIEGEEPQLSEDVKLGFFRVAQEALNNTRKHSKASQVKIEIRFKRDKISMTVNDNGEGFNAQELMRKNIGKGNLGLLSMKERADLINADLKIDSEPGKGTKVTLQARI